MNILLKNLLKLLSPHRHAEYCGVKMGNNVFWASRYVPTEPYLVEIGNNVQITEGVKIFTHGGAHVARYKDPTFDTFGKVIIGDWTYIGTDSLIMPGCTIGEHCLIAAGSVVTKSIPSGYVVGGNPAKIICTTEDYIIKNKIYNTGTKNLSKSHKRKILESGNLKFITK